MFFEKATIFGVIHSLPRNGDFDDLPFILFLFFLSFHFIWHDLEYLLAYY